MGTTRVLITDDHAIVRAGLRMLLEDQDDMEVVGEARNGEECVDQVSRLKPDVVLMDVAMPGMDGIAATRLIKETSPGVQVLGLTMHQDENYFFQMLRAGASGYVIKGADPEELFTAIRAVAGGEAYLYSSLTKKLLDDYLDRVKAGDVSDSHDRLSDREKEVLQLIGEGLTSREIAGSLYLSVNTVDRHRSNIMDKLDLHNKAGLIKYAIRKGLVEP